MTTAILTPYAKAPAARAGRRLWRKQILPVGEIDYKGRKIAFTRDYLDSLAKAFTSRAYDQVPFQIADAANTHTNDPERFRGEVAAVELTDDGLDVIVAATDEGSRVLEANPQLGVSARIVEDYQRADGKFFPAAVQHVLGTLDPRITGMRPWQAIENAGEADEVIDLTGSEYGPAAVTAEQEETGMALTKEQEDRLAKLLGLPDDQFEALLGGKPQETEPEDDEEISDEELDALIAAAAEEDPSLTAGLETETETEGEKVPVGLSADAQAAIDLANARAEENEAELARYRARLDASEYEAERRTLAEKHGIPPRITDLARPLLEGEGHVIDLANGSQADAGAIMRKVLAEFGKTMKLLDLSAETGSPEGRDGSSEDEARERRSATVAAFRAQAGI